MNERLLLLLLLAALSLAAGSCRSVRKGKTETYAAGRSVQAASVDASSLEELAEVEVWEETVEYGTPPAGSSDGACRRMVHRTAVRKRTANAQETATVAVENDSVSFAGREHSSEERKRGFAWTLPLVVATILLAMAIYALKKHKN